jgi:hypothetical protein
MSMTYTFPSMTMPGGALQIKVITSEGTGTSNQTEKAFIEIDPFIRETELEGGLLRADNMKFKVLDPITAYLELGGVRTLFHDTIFPTLEVESAYVDIVVLWTPRGGTQVKKFHGIVEPNTIHYEDWYNNEDGAEYTRKTVSFEAVWTLKRLESITSLDVSEMLKTYEAQISPWVNDSGDFASVEGYAYPFTWVSYVSYQHIIGVIFSLFDSAFGFSSSLIYRTQLGFIQRDLFHDRQDYGAISLTDSMFPGGCGRVFRINTDSVTGYTTTWSNFITEQDTAYKLLLSILNDFGLILEIEYTSLTDGLQFNILDRVTAAEIVPVGLLESSKDGLATEYRDSVEITDSIVTVKKSKGNTAKQGYSYNAVHSFINPDNAVGMADEFITPNTVAILTTVGEGAKIVGARYGFRGSVLGTIKEDSSAMDAALTISQTFSATDEPIVTHFWVRAGYSATVVALIKYYDEADNIVATYTKSMAIGTITSRAYSDTYFPFNHLFVPFGGTTWYGIGANIDSWGNVFDLTAYTAGKTKIARVDTTFTPTVSDDQNTLYVGQHQCWRGYDSLAGVLSWKLYKLFTSIRKKIVQKLNGIQTFWMGSYVTILGTRYYIKKHVEDFYNNETEIGAINYDA